MADDRIAPPPEHLSERSKALWQDAVSEPWRSVKLALLEEGLRALDRADQAAAILAREGLTTAKDGGIDHPHPAIRIERDSRAQFAAIWARLKLDIAHRRDR